MQTDKTTVEIPSPRAGTVLKILVEEGDVAPVGAVLVVIGQEGEQLLRAVEDEQPRGAQPASPSCPSSRPTRAPAVRATPAVRQLAKKLGVDLLGVRGTGPGRSHRRGRRPRRGGRVAEGRGSRCAASGARSSSRSSRTHREVPAVTFVEECDFAGDRPRPGSSLTRFMRPPRRSPEFPVLNARLDGTSIVLLDRIDVGVAVQTDDGLVVPVVRGCESFTVDEIDAEVRRLAEAARAGTLAASELRDSTFTVTSAGKLGGLFVTPLVNHPEVAILGLHRVADRPVVRDGQVVVRPMGNVSVTFDHRVVDGVVAAAFCLDVIRRLEGGGGS